MKKKSAAKTRGHSPWRIRLFVAAVVIVVGACVLPVLFDRTALPAPIRDSRPVVTLYETHGRALRIADRALNGAPIVTEEEKQTGYPKDDRHQLEKIINKSAQEH
ncbi:MAG TPA: hypothetical protein VEF76_09855 [Patescibacteria group bacterium]|nr:hypothetical protein [Patescibacteria group bacterium]